MQGGGSKVALLHGTANIYWLMQSGGGGGGEKNEEA